MHTITEERDLLRRECAELRAAIGAGGAARGGCGGAGAGFGAGADEFPTAFPMDTDAATPRLAAAEAVLMETCHAPPRRSFESLCFVAAPAVRKPLFGFAS